MSRYDVIILGGGPAGMCAAIAARQHGLQVAIVDEAPRPGGQVYRAPSRILQPQERTGATDLAKGETLRAAVAASGAHLLTRHRAWAAAPGMRVDCLAPDGPVSLEADALILATGTTERVIPMPGLTLPGVIGLAAATILLKAHAAVPAGPTVVAGVGPLLYAVASGIRKAGGRVAAVVDLLAPSDWAAGLPGLISRPDLLARGAGWMASLRSAGVPIHHRATLAAVHGTDGVEAVDIAKVAADWSILPGRSTRIAAVSVAVGHGLVPATEFARLLGVAHRYVAARGGWVPDVAADGRAADQLYIVGDCAGVSGAAAAEFAGTLAGLSVARDLGRIPPDTYEALAGPVRARLRRAQRFGGAISALMALRPGLARGIAPETIVCRCEDIPRHVIDAAVAGGVRHVNQLKSTTRCGMGPCQGRSCADAAGEIVAAEAGLSREAVGIWTARAPLRPIPLEVALGDFTYADIPRPPMLPA